jgi:hypothetical protein
MKGGQQTVPIACDSQDLTQRTSSEDIILPFLKETIDRFFPKMQRSGDVVS